MTPHRSAATPLLRCVGFVGFFITTTLLLPPQSAWAQLTPVLEWSWTSSTTLPTYLNVLATPTVVDFNGDGTPDVVFAATNAVAAGNSQPGVIRVLDGQTGAEILTTSSSFLVSAAATPAVGDIDQDGQPELVTIDALGTGAIAFETDGTVLWTSPVLGPLAFAGVSLADLNLDGTVEVVVGQHVLDNVGALMWSGTASIGDHTTNSGGQLSIVADINLDGIPEIIAGNSAYSTNGAVIWTALNTTDGYTAVANVLTVDPEPEVVLISSGSAWLLDHQGNVVWGPVTLPGASTQSMRGGAPAVADVDNDGELEVMVSHGSLCVVLEAVDGLILWTAPIVDDSAQAGCTAFDLEGDGAVEVIHRDQTTLRVFRGADGFELFSVPMSSCTWTEYAAVADVDLDGHVEIIIGANNNCGFGSQQGMYVYGDDANWQPGRSIWNQHSYHITNVEFDATLPLFESNNWETHNNYRVQQGPQSFMRGDVNADGLFNALTDALALLSFGFQNGPAPSCEDAADFNDDGVLSALNDTLGILAFGFNSGPPPAPPGLTCGTDPSEPDLSCIGYAPCP